MSARWSLARRPLAAAVALVAASGGLLPGEESQAGHGGAHVHDRYFGIADNSNIGIAWHPTDPARRDPRCQREGWDRQACMELMFALNRDHGMSWAGIAAGWWQIVADQSANPPDWTELDAMVSAAACQDVQPVIGVIGTPADIRVGGGEGDPTSPPTADARGSIPELERFVAELVARYGPGGEMPAGSCLDGSIPSPAVRAVPAIIVWNEQNARGHWGGEDPFGVTRGCHRGTPPPSAPGVPACDSRLHYLRMLRSARLGRDIANPAVEVVTGGLTIPAVDGGRFRYFETLYGRGIPPNPQFDVLGVHPYAPRGGRDESGRSVGDVIAGLRAEMTARGAGEKRIWITEAGWPSCRTEHPDYPRRYNPGACPPGGGEFDDRNSTEAAQRAKLVSSIAWLTENRDALNLDRFALWGFVDLGQCGWAYIDHTGWGRTFPPASPPVLPTSVRIGPPGRGGRGCVSDATEGGGAPFDVGTSTEADFINQATPAACRWCEGAGLLRKDWSPKPALFGWRDQVIYWRGQLNP